MMCSISESRAGLRCPDGTTTNVVAGITLASSITPVQTIEARIG